MTERRVHRTIITVYLDVVYTILFRSSVKNSIVAVAVVVVAIDSAAAETYAVN